MSRVSFLSFLSITTAAGAKPIHFEELKFQLLEQNIRCTDCHVADNDATLTSYGRRIADADAAQSIQSRVRTNEEELSQTMSERDRKRAAGRIDVDGDELANWVEILAGTDPSTPNQKNERHTAIEGTISCLLCHTTVDRFPRPGEDKAPHNAFGDALEALAEMGAKRNKPARENEPAKPILPRLEKMRAKDTDRDGVKDLDEINSYHAPADKSDAPAADEVRLLNDRRRDRKNSDSGFGQIHKDKTPPGKSKER